MLARRLLVNVIVEGHAGFLQCPSACRLQVALPQLHKFSPLLAFHPRRIPQPVVFRSRQSIISFCFQGFVFLATYLIHGFTQMFSDVSCSHSTAQPPEECPVSRRPEGLASMRY